MEFLKRFQYSLILFVICITIFLSGVLPNGTKLFHRFFVEPEEYVEARGVITAMEEFDSLQARKTYHVYVTFFLEDGETEVTAELEQYVEGMREDMEINFLYYRKNPDYVFQKWQQGREFLLHSGSTLLSLFTALMMTQPASLPYEHRKPKTLRQRLEKY